MDSYSKKNIKIAGIITGISILAGFLGQWLTHEYLFMNIAAIVVGLNLIYFSHDLTMERVVKYHLNYKFYRAMYILAGIAFVVISIVTLVNH